MLSTRPLRLALAAARARTRARALSDEALPSADLATPSPESAVASSGYTRGDNLGRRLLNLVYPKRSAVVAIRKWIEEGNTVKEMHLHRVIGHLRERKRYKHALEICEWRTIQNNFRLQPGDYAVHLDLVGKVRGLASAQKFFEDLPEQMKKQSTYTSLLHSYVQNKEHSKAESLFEEMSRRGFLTSCLPYNHILNLYVSNGKLDKIPDVIEELKKNTSPDVVTYNLWLTACANGNDVSGAEKIVHEMEESKVQSDWITYSILSKIYINEGMLAQAQKSLRLMEKIISKKDRKAYCSLITLHANLLDKDNVTRTWQEMKHRFRKMSDAEYTSVISSLLRLRDIAEAEAIYSEWESVSVTRDVKVSNVLLSAYTKNGMMEKAKLFLEEAQQKGTKPNYYTWATLARGYLEQNQIDAALDCIHSAFSSLKKWKFEPNDSIVKTVCDNLEMAGDIERAERFLVILRTAGFVTTQVYNSLLRTYAKAGKMPLIVTERMNKDGVEQNDETKQLLNMTSRLCVSEVSTLLS